MKLSERGGVSPLILAPNSNNIQVSRSTSGVAAFRQSAGE